ncbi:MAG: hypothetical protein LC099_04430 [Anaerolineales bacterium]|nr:hypothetical protein [Anaerolineales bacterium]
MPPQETPTPEATQTETATPPPTFTPVPPSPTFTATPTLIGFTATPMRIVEETFTPTIAPPTQETLEAPSTFAPSVEMKGVSMVNLTLTEFYKGKKCEPNVVRIAAQITDKSASHILLFVRFKNLKTDGVSKWTNKEMLPFGAGTYVFDLSSDDMLEDQYFTTAWVEYQIILTNARGKKIGGTGIFKERLMMLPCVPTPTPTSETIKP